MRRYRVYGLTLASDVDFSLSLPPARSEADVVFSCVDDAPVDVEWDSAPAVYTEAAGGVEEMFAFHRFGEVDVVRIAGATDFYLFEDRIVCHVLDPRHRYLVEIALFGMVLSLWLERRGVVTLHASAAVVGGRAVAFVCAKGGGKTTTAAALVQAGHALLTDDLLAVAPDGEGFLAQPAHPQLRLWPEQAAHFVGAFEHLPTPHPDSVKRRVTVGTGTFGAFAAAPHALHRLYVPERVPATGQAGEVVITAVPPREQLIALVRHSFLPVEVHRFGWQPQRLERLAALTRAVPMRRVRYPAGFEHLPALVDAIVADASEGP